MSEISSVLVHVDESRHCPDRIRFAADLAQRSHASLAGLAVVAGGMPPSPPARHDTLKSWNAAMTEHRQFVRGRVEEHFAGLRRQMPGAQCDTRELQGAGKIAAVIAQEARRADLVVLGQNTADMARPNGTGMTAQDVMLTCGRPVLLVPHVGGFPGISKRPLIAWSESREAARALQDALPLLRYADTVYLLEVGDPDASPGDIARRRTALAGVARYLESHALLVAVEYLPAAHAGDPGRLILSRANECGADLLVMGGYGHSRVWEIAWGGVTRSILSSMNLPVLMSH